MAGEHEIVFEDLHGSKEDSPVTVDLDADTKDQGITGDPAADAAKQGSSEDDDSALGAQPDDDDDSSGGDGDEAGASSGSEDDAYSKKVKARIDRERRQTKKARDEAKYWQDQAQKLAKDTSKTARDSLQSRIEQATSAIESTQSELERSIEDGNTKDQVRLTSKLTDLKAEKIQAEARLNDLPEDGDLPPFDGKVSPQTGKANLADQWIEDRSEWYGAKGFERQTRLANRIDKELYKEGYDPSEPDYFEELDRRIKEAAPELYDDEDQTPGKESGGETETRRGRKRQSPVAGVDTTDNRRRSGNRSKVQLTEADFENMRRFNLNVNDPEVLKEYARNKAEGAS